MKALINYNKEELKSHINTYLLAKTYLQFIQETAKELETDVLNNCVFMESQKWVDLAAKRGIIRERERITKPENTYLMNDEDFQIYLDLIYESYKAAGIADKRGRGFCPDSEARDLFYAAEKELIKYGIKIMPEIVNKEKFLEGMRNTKHKECFLEIILKLPT